MSEIVKMTINIDKDLKKQLRMIALDKELTVTEIVGQLVQDYVDDYNKQQYLYTIQDKNKNVVKKLMTILSVAVFLFNNIMVESNWIVA